MLEWMSWGANAYGHALERHEDNEDCKDYRSNKNFEKCLDLDTNERGFNYFEKKKEVPIKKVNLFALSIFILCVIGMAGLISFFIFISRNQISGVAGETGALFGFLFMISLCSAGNIKNV